MNKIYKQSCSSPNEFLRTFKDVIKICMNNLVDCLYLN